jgi:hypothetical protein
MSNQLVTTIHKLGKQFVKYHYDAYLAEKNVSIIDDTEVEYVVSKLYTKNKKEEMKDFIRFTLEEMLAKNYDSIAIEAILLQIDTNDLDIKDNLINEIKRFQKCTT